MKTDSHTFYSTLQNNIILGAFVGQNILTFKEIPSTNNLMKELMAKSTPLPEGTVIMAEHQTAGKGQQQNVWHSEAGKNLLFSLLLLPRFLQPDHSFGLVAAISLGVIKPLQEILGENVRIKWPNDIYYGQKKLGGILIENIWAGQNLKYAVVGVGININQDVFPDYLPNPVSLKQILQKKSAIKEVLLQICAGIETYYLRLKDKGYATIKQEYLDNLYGFGQQLDFESNNEIFKGEISGINHLGLLGVKKKEEVVFFDLKQIKFIFN